MQKHTKSIFPGSSLETRLSVDITAEKQGWEKNMLSVNWMDQQP
jgi:ornithine carbamoyltransferase